MPVRRIFIPSLGHAKLLLLHHQRLVLLVPGYGRREETAPGLAIIHQPTAIWLHILHRIGEKALVLKRLERHAIDEIAITQSLIHASENAGLTRAENHIPWHGSLRAVYEVVVGLQRLSRIGGGIGIDLPAFFNSFRQKGLDAAVMFHKIDQLLCSGAIRTVRLCRTILARSRQGHKNKDASSILNEL